MKSKVETCALVLFFLCGISAAVFSIASVVLDHWAVVSIPRLTRPSSSGGGFSFSDALDLFNEVSDSIGDDDDRRPRPPSDISLSRNPGSSSSSGSSSSGSSSSGSSSSGSSSSGSSSSGTSSSGSSSSGSSSSSESFPSSSFDRPPINIPNINLRPINIPNVNRPSIPDLSSSNFRPSTINRPNRFPGRRRRRSTDTTMPIFSFSPRTICTSVSSAVATLDDFQCVSVSDIPDEYFSNSSLKEIQYLVLIGVAGISVGVFLFMIGSFCDNSILLFIGLISHAIAALLYLVGVILFSSEDSFFGIFSSNSEQSFNTPYYLSIVAVVLNFIVFFIGSYGACCSKRNAL